MTGSGDAAEQIVRMSLEGVEVAARITGNAAKEIATLLFASLKSKNSNLKLKGKARLTTMLKSGKALEIYSLKERDLQKFVQGAKEYGIVYCVLRNTKNNPDGLCDIMVKADDAPKISRLSERFKFATVDKAKIESEIVAAKAEKAAADQRDAGPNDAHGAEREEPDINDTDKLVDDLMGERGPRETEFRGERRSDGVSELSRRNAEARDTQSATTKGKAAPEPTKVEQNQAGKEAVDNSPLAAGGQQKANLSAPTSENRNSSAKGAFSRPSVKEEIREIKAARKLVDSVELIMDNDKKTSLSTMPYPLSTEHKQPRGTKKSKKPKERT